MIVLKGHRAPVTSVGFSPDGAAVIAPTWRGVQVWRPFAAGGKPGVIADSFPGRFQITPDGGKLLTAGLTLRLLDLGTCGAGGQPLREWFGKFFALSHRGDVFVTGSNAGDGHRMAARRVTDGTALWERPADGWDVHPLFLPGDAEFVRVVSGHDGRGPVYRITAHATSTGEELRRSDPLADRVVDWAVSPDGALAACRVTLWVHVYPVPAPFVGPLASIRNDSRREYTGLAFHPSGRYLAATSNDQTVKLYDTASWRVAKTYTWEIGRMRSVAFSPDGTLAAAGSDTGRIVVWDVDV